MGYYAGKLTENCFYSPAAYDLQTFSRFPEQVNYAVKLIENVVYYLIS